MVLPVALALVLGCQGGAGSAPASDAASGGAASSSKPGVLVSAPGYAARVAAAWEKAEPVTLSAEGQEFLRRVKAPVVLDVAAAVTPVDGVETKDLRADAALTALLLATDEKAAATAIRATGARALVVHSSLRPSMDRSKNVLSRLYNHDGLEYFQLARVEDGAMVYLVVDQPLQFTPELAGAAIAWIRASLSGENPPPFPATKPERSNWSLVASLRGHGQEVAFSLAEGPTLDAALYEVVRDLEAFHRRQKEPLGFPPLKEHMADLRIELHRVTERAAVVPRDEASIEDLWEMGLDGAILLDRVGEKKQSAVWPGAVAASRGITKADSFLRALAREFRWDSIRPWREPETELELIRTTHYLEVPGQGAVELYRGTPPVPLDFVNQTTAREAIVLAGEWYLANLTPEGQVTYKFWPEENRYSNEYNHVRHTLATWNLWQAWTLDPRPEFLEGAIRAQDWTLRALGEKDGMAFLSYGGQTKLGSVVVALLGMIEVAKATGDHSHDELMRKFGKFVMFMQADSGTFRGYWDPATGNFVEQVNDIVPGEAALSLVYLYEYFQDPQYLEPLPKFFAYYKPWFEERAKRRNPDGPWPAYTYDNATRLELVQFGPWTVMAASAYTRVKPEAKDVSEFGLAVARWMIDTYEYTEANAPFPDYVGGYYKFQGELPAMQAFCYAEGTAAAYDMALRQAPDQAPFFETHTREAVRMGLQMQHDGLDSVYYSRPLEILGGIKYALNEPKVRIDYVHHALSAMYQWLMASRKDPALPEVAKRTPDAAMARILKLQDMPGYRDPAAPAWTRAQPMAAPGTVRRTSLPKATAPSASAGVEAAAEDDGAE